MALLLVLLLSGTLMAAPPAEIVRDNFGVPHIYGAKDSDVVFGLAYAMAEDNFWQLEEDYIRALGRASELYGTAGVGGDVAYRAWRVGERAREDYGKASPYLRSICDAFAAGYNHYLEKNPGAKPRLLKRMEPWHVLAFQIPRTLSGAGVRREDNVREFPILSGAPAERESGDEGEEGSNMWAVSPRKSATGAAMLFLNPHVGFFGGGQRFEAHLESKEGLSVSGFAILGTPYLRSGFGARHGWVHTNNNNADIADVYREKFDQPSAPLAYRYGDSHRQGEAWTAEIPVLTGGKLETRTLKLRRTHHGPIVGQADGMSLALRALEISPLALMAQRIDMTKARSLAEFQKVMARRALTGSNTMYADRKGNIWYLHGNAIPKRDPALDWSKPADGWAPETEWRGIHKFSELPQYLNPPSGYLQNCNSTPVNAAGEAKDRPQYPRYFVPELDNLRAKRSRQILQGKDKFTFEEWAAAALDTGVYLAERERSFVRSWWPEFQKRNPERAGVIRDAVETVLAWDGVSRNDSVAMSLLMTAFHARKGKDDTTPYLSAEAMEAARAQLEKTFGDWRQGWGAINRLQRIHTSGRLEAYSDAKPSFPVPGAPGTVGIVFNAYGSAPEGQKKIYCRMGNSYIAVVEFGSKIQSRSLLVFGQSADPASKHHLDQAPLYSNQKFKPAYYYPKDVRAHAERTYRVGQ